MTTKLDETINVHVWLPNGLIIPLAECSYNSEDRAFDFNELDGVDLEREAEKLSKYLDLRVSVSVRRQATAEPPRTVTGDLPA